MANKCRITTSSHCRDWWDCF